MAALQYVHVPGYSAILFRKTYADLSLPGALMDRAATWLTGCGARWRGVEKRWDFPNGSKLSFAYLQHPTDKYRYQGSEYQFIGFDEVTQFDQADYLYLFSRLRRTNDIPVPLRMRAASNPGGRGHDWVKARFITDPSDRVFIPAKLDDNPHINRDEYRENLQNLDHITRKQLLLGDWDVLPNGDIFLRDWFRYAQEKNGFYRTEKAVVAVNECSRFATVDLAISEKLSADYTVICIWALTPNGHLILLDLWRGRIDAPTTISRIKTLYAKYDLDWVGVEDVGYQRSIIQQLILEDVTAKGLKPSGDKVARAQAASIRFEAGMVHLMDGEWRNDLEREMLAFPNAPHDDMVDAVSYGCFAASRYARGKLGTPAVDAVEEEPEKSEHEKLTEREKAFMFGDDDDD